MDASSRVDLTRFAWLSIVAALVTMGMKAGAWWLTGSVGLLSDAAESSVNLVAAVAALVVLRVAARPADAGHPFGHTKAEYLSAVLEGAMIFVAAVLILFSAVRRLLDPHPIEQVGLGLAISVVAAAINGAVAVVLLRVGRRHRSVTLVADGRHLLTDVWTSAGVLVGVTLVAVTGWLRLDPIVALLVGANILWAGYRLVSSSVSGLLDQSLPESDRRVVDETIAEYAGPEVAFHAVRSRMAGSRSFLTMHVLVPGAWSLWRAHDLVEEVERRLEAQIPGLEVSTHLEPIEDPRAYEAHLGVVREE